MQKKMTRIEIELYMEAEMKGFINQRTKLANEYITPDILDFFKKKLMNWRKEMVDLSDKYMLDLKNTGIRESDPVDFGSRQAEKERDLMTIKRSSQIILQIDSALHRIEQGEYGYCALTGEEIGIERLKVMPLAILSVQAQEEIEKRNRLTRAYS